jgi:AcrR family transcriptional regulator
VTSSVPSTDIRQSPKPPPLGLRERKKMQTRAAIQRHALRLFRENGFPATTMEQIAEAADISPSTLYRYFPTKEDLVLSDDYDPILMAAFQTQPADLGPVEALRATIASVFGALSAEERATLQERLRLTFTIPEVRARFMNDVIQSSEMLSELFAIRLGRTPDDFDVRVLAGTVIGALLAAHIAWNANPQGELVDMMDRALQSLIAGPGNLGPVTR